METLSNCGREEKSDLEMEYEARLKEMDEKHQHELQELENAYQQKIMGEVERYQVICCLCVKLRNLVTCLYCHGGYNISVVVSSLAVSQTWSHLRVCLSCHTQALVQERNMQQDRWNEQQQLLVTTHER